MTKLMRLLFLLFVLFMAWSSLVYYGTNVCYPKLAKDGLSLRENIILWMPIWGVALFGAYSVFTVLYRTFTFNDCPEAAVELQKQTQQARAELRPRFKNKELLS